MPPLIEKWNQLRDTDKDLFPLLEVSSAGCHSALAVNSRTFVCVDYVVKSSILSVADTNHIQ